VRTLEEWLGSHLPDAIALGILVIIWGIMLCAVVILPAMAYSLASTIK
jgi:hypothetical protein